MSRRAGAIVAILGLALGVGVASYDFITDFPRGLLAFGCLFAALAVTWVGLLRRGPARLAGLMAGALLIGIAIGITVAGENALALAVVLVSFLAGVGGARAAFRPERRLPRAEPPRHPVLFVNPRSGDGRAAKVGLAEAARERDIETVVLKPGEDLGDLVRAAVGRGADALAMAGGDGSQALVAAIAAESKLPYACIPSGTRNHFALDLGVDREDVVGALDALLDGGRRYVDLGEVNGRVFVNNVSLGVYAEAVGQDRYRESKLRTLLDTLAETLGPGGEASELRWKDGKGVERASTALVLVSNNPYLLGPTLGSGTRPRLDTGRLGVVDFHPPIAGSKSHLARWNELTARELVVESDAPVPVGVDGESLVLESPLRFQVRPKALEVRISRKHPGASPSADIPKGPLSALKQLFRVSLGQ